MIDVLVAGGWLMLPIVGCSVLALTIVFERFYMLSPQRVLPNSARDQARLLCDGAEVDSSAVATLGQSSPLGMVLAAVVLTRDWLPKTRTQKVEGVGRQVVHDLERFLNTLGTIAGITPLLGLLGTVIGMIKVFQTIQVAGVGQPTLLAGGISEALITTAAGLSVAIPSYFFYRYYRARVRALALELEGAVSDLMEKDNQQ